MNKRAFPVSLLTACFLGGFSTTAAWGLPLVGFPDADATSGQFITVTRGLSSLGDVGTQQNTINISLAVPASLATFKVNIFDGDMVVGSHWDRNAGEVDALEFKLFRDPNLVNNTNPVDQLFSWNANDMPDNGWCELGAQGCQEGAALPRDIAACPNYPSGSCYYHLVADWVNAHHTDEQNSFKVAVEGQPFLRAGSTIGFEVFGCDHIANPNCTEILSQLSGTQIEDTTYNGSLSFEFLVKEPSVRLMLFDGDADLLGDTGDLNSPSCDPWTGDSLTVSRNRSCTMPVDDTGPFADTVCEAQPGDCIVTHSQAGVPGVVLYPPFQVSPDDQAQGIRPGSPQDDSMWPVYQVPPPVNYEVTSPGGGWTVTNENPSGDSEWEQFIIQLEDGLLPDEFPLGVIAPDVKVTSLPAGLYRWRFIGLDYANTLFVHCLYDVFPGGNHECKLSLTKTCSTPHDPVPSSNCVAKIGDPVSYSYTVSNSGDAIASGVSLNDNRLGVVAENIFLNPGEAKSFTGGPTIVSTDMENVATVALSDGIVCANASATLKVRQGGEGCTPGYWRQTKTYSWWNAAGFDPAQTYASVFGVGYGAPANTSITLAAVVRASGGGYANLGRHSVAALLNAASSGVDYLFSVDEVIARVKAAYASGDLKIIENTATTFQQQNDLLAPICK